MSSVSSRVNSVSSILRSPGVRSQLNQQSQRVNFKLPTNIRSIICNFQPKIVSKEYEDLLCLICNTNIRDKDLLELLEEGRICLPLLGSEHERLIDVLLKINWIDRSPEVVLSYKTFLGDIVCVQVHHTKRIIDNLVEQFKPASDDAEWENGICSEADNKRLNIIHDVLRSILKITPMSCKLLLQSIRERFPYITHSSHIHEVYVFAILQITDYAPQLRSDIISLIINRLTIMDVNIPRVSVEDYDVNCDGSDDNDDDYSMADDHEIENDNSSEDKRTEQLITHTLDVCLVQVYSYIQKVSLSNEFLNIKSPNSLYRHILQAFDTVILPTYDSQHVQFIMFYLCSFNRIIVEAFIDWLWQKLIDPNIPSIIRQSSASYIGSLLVTAGFVSPELVKVMLLKMSKWIHNYIYIQECSHSANDTREHSVFYFTCQALFLIIAAKHANLVNSKTNILYLQQLGLSKIVTCKLNPLKACRSKIMHDFANIMQTYQLAYCNVIIEDNKRNLHIQNKGRIPISRDIFLPFRQYGMLQWSGERLQQHFCHNKLYANHKLDNSNHMDESIEFAID